MCLLSLLHVGSKVVVTFIDTFHYFCHIFQKQTKFTITTTDAMGAPPREKTLICNIYLPSQWNHYSLWKKILSLKIAPISLNLTWPRSLVSKYLFSICLQPYFDKEFSEAFYIKLEEYVITTLSTLLLIEYQSQDQRASNFETD